MLASAHETVSKATIKFLHNCRCLPLQRRKGHTITQQFGPSWSNEKVKHRKSSGEQRNKKIYVISETWLYLLSVKGEECHIFLSGSRISLNIQRIHFQLPCWRDRTIKDIRRLLAIQSERINGECKTRSKYYDRMIWEFCRHGLGFAYLKRQSIPCK